MKVLFVHQNFPAQFKHLAPALRDNGHQVKALTISSNSQPALVDVVHYTLTRGNTPHIHPWLLDMESKVIRAEAVFLAAAAMREQGYFPDVIVAHPGWGESLFLKDIWPQARLGLYCEFYYQHGRNEMGFDPEFGCPEITEPCRLRMKNANHDLQFASATRLLSPTQFQRSTFPETLQNKIDVIHEGIDTQLLRPDGQVELQLNNIVIQRSDEIITFINRNLEPLRGYHIFMRALPEIMRSRPNSRVIIVGGDKVSYGSQPVQGSSWKQIFFDEVAAQLDRDRVHFVGKIAHANLIQLLQISRVHVYLTYPFVLSWSLLEAMSIGCAIVASDTAPVREVIKDGEMGILVDFFDTKNLAAQVVSLLQNPVERERLGSAAREFVQAHYDLHGMSLPKQLAWVQSLWDAEP